MLVVVDLGTSGCKVLAFDPQGRRLAYGRRTYSATLDATGRVEQSSDSWWDAFRGALHEAGVRSLLDRVAAIAITSLRAAVLAIDGAGTALGPAILASDQRAREEALFLRQFIGEERLYDITGLRTDFYFPLPRILWLKKHHRDIFGRAKKLIGGQEYLIQRLCGRVVMDTSHASRWLCFNVRAREWDSELLEKLDLRSGIFPELVDPGATVGEVEPALAREIGLPVVPVVAAGGDQTCASLGMGALDAGTLTINHGTGTFLESPRRFPQFDKEKRFLCSVHVVPGEWIVECPILVAGRLLDEQMKFFCGPEVDVESEYARVFDMAASPTTGEALVYLPYQGGSTSPHWQERLRGVIWGLQSSTQPRQILRALGEGILFDVRRSIDLFPTRPTEVIVAGRLAQLDGFNQMQADILNLPVVRVAEPEATALGAAIVASVSVGVHPSIPEAVKAMTRKVESSQKCPRADSRDHYQNLFDKHERILRWALHEAKEGTKSPCPS